MKRLYALRGAAQALNTVDDICLQITLMYDEMLSANKLCENDIVSLIFSITNDLDVINPSTALRKCGRGGELALFSVLEPDCYGSLERTVRVIIHCYLDEGSKPCHVYRNGAEVLRPDRQITQF
jgi:chorismate mutase